MLDKLYTFIIYIHISHVHRASDYLGPFGIFWVQGSLGTYGLLIKKQSVNRAKVFGKVN